ncbi:restriction endonuclease subunit S [uncultured Rhodoblastus sp.]|uniref:restriction endonuclease subunit S n=1 Tax=uncultured Rhodoblastus sp. TaxID=543037 RepID=UPI0025DE273F|nr:restriction endonuclease subunit S [uncultured Rhodoblastus sp.]
MLLSSICSISPGFTARSRLEPTDSGGVLTIQLRDIEQDGTVDITRMSRVVMDAAAEKYFVHPGDVVFRSRGDWNVASAIDAALSEPALAVMPLFILRPKSSVVIPDFLAWAINQAPAQRHFDCEAQGGNMRMISRSTLETLDLDIPPVATQRRIVEIDRLARQERQLTLDLAEKQRQIVTRRLVDLAENLGKHLDKPRPRISKTSGNRK